MLNRSTLRPTSLAPQNTGLHDERAQPALDARGRALARLLQLPTTFQGYAFLVACLLILAFTMVLHITLSAEIMRMEVKVLALKDDYARIEQTNANVVWQIANFSSLREIEERARGNQYVAEIPVKYVKPPVEVTTSPAFSADPADSPVLSAPVQAAPAQAAPSATDGRLVVLTQPQNRAEPETRAPPSSRSQEMADTFRRWLQEFIPGASQTAP